MRYIKYIILTIILILNFNYASAITTNGADYNGATVEQSVPFLMCHGDSHTVGSDSTEGYGYRQFLFPLLTDKTYRFVGSNSWYIPRVGGIQYQPLLYLDTFGWHSGASGQTTADIEARTAADMTANFGSHPSTESVMLLHAGVNDLSACTPCNAGDIDAVVVNMIDIIDIKVTNNPTISMYVALSIPSVTAGLDTDITAYNVDLNVALLAKQGTVANLYIVDMNAAFKASGTWDTDYFTAPKEVHPNDAGYLLMAQTWATAILMNE